MAGYPTNGSKKNILWIRTRLLTRRASPPQPPGRSLPARSSRDPADRLLATVRPSTQTARVRPTAAAQTSPFDVLITCRGVDPTSAVSMNWRRSARPQRGNAPGPTPNQSRRLAISWRTALSTPGLRFALRSLDLIRQSIRFSNELKDERILWFTYLCPV